MADSEQILQLCSEMAPGNHLRQQAELVLLNPAAPIEDAAPIISALNEMPWRAPTDRAIISWLVSTVKWPETHRARISDTLSKLVYRGVNTRNSGRAAMQWVTCGLLLFPIALFGMDMALPSYSACASSMLDLFVEGLLCYLIIRSLGSFLSGPWSRWFDEGTASQFAPCVELLGKVGQPSAMGPLAEAYLHWPLRRSAAPALSQVVARLRPEHYGSLPAQTVPALCRALEAADHDGAVVILRALDLVGDGRAICAVEYAAHNTANPELRDAAVKLIRVLNRRRNENRTSGMLLRPSSASTEAPETLLRVVCEQSVIDEAQLLRVTPD